MDVRKYLHDKGYNWKEVRRADHMEAIFQCPNCKTEKDKFAINLSNGAYKCMRINNCNFHGSWADFMKFHGDKYTPIGHEVKATKREYRMPDIHSDKRNDKLYNYFKSRGITSETVTAYRIGQNNNEIIFPYYKDNKMVNAKYRNITEKKFRKEKDCMSVLFGQDLIDSSYLIIVEGEIDALSLYEYNIKGVSIPSGVNDLTWIENDWDFLEQFKDIYIIMDNDHAGQTSVSKLVSRLGEWRCKNVVLPYKDINECLLNKVSAERIQEIIFDECIEFDLNELKSAECYIDEIIDYLNNPELGHGTKSGFDELDKMLKGFRKNEVTLWSGQNGSGKSTVLNQIMSNFILNGEKCCVGSFEMKPKNYLIWLTKQMLKKQDIDKKDVTELLKKVKNNLFIIDIVGDIEKDHMFSIMEFASRKHGINHFIIDSLMKISFSTNESKLLLEQRKLFSEFKAFADKYDNHIHVVAHPRKSSDDSHIPGKNDVAGSGDMMNLSDNAIMMHRFTEEQKAQLLRDNKENYDATLLLKKNRFDGELGSFGLFFDNKTKRFTENNPIFEQKNNMDYIHN